MIRLATLQVLITSILLSSNNHPIILVHGFLGWGKEEVGDKNYWKTLWTYLFGDVFNLIIIFFLKIFATKTDSTFDWNEIINICDIYCIKFNTIY